MNFTLLIAILLIGGLLFSYLFKLIKLPGIIGMLSFGLIFGLLSVSISVDQGPKNFWDLFRNLALSIVMVRAGLSINFQDIKSMGFRIILLGILPGLFEAGFIFILLTSVFAWPISDALFLSFLISALSPAIVFPRLFASRERGLFTKTSSVLIASTTIDNIYAITVASFVFILPGAEKLDVLAVSSIGFLLSLGLGLVLGWALYKLFSRFNAKVRATEKALVICAICLVLGGLGAQFKFSSIPALVSMAMVLAAKSSELTKEIGLKLQKLWIGAEILLFTSLGLTISTQINSIHIDILFLGFVVFITGMLGRLPLAQILLPKNTPVLKRQLVFSAGIPKATVQATLGGWAIGVPGFMYGNEIYLISLLIIIISAPVGAILMDAVMKKALLKNQP